MNDLSLRSSTNRWALLVAGDEAMKKYEKEVERELLKLEGKKQKVT